MEPDPDPLLRKGGSEDPDPVPLFPNVDPRIRIRIHVKMRWIRNAGLSYQFMYITTYLHDDIKYFKMIGYYLKLIVVICLIF